MSFLATSGCDVWAFYRSSAKKTDRGDAKDDDDDDGGGGDDIEAIKTGDSGSGFEGRTAIDPLMSRI